MICTVCLSCSDHPAPGTLVMDIESSPVNLDPRVGTDSQSERIAELIFDPLVRKDDHFNLLPWVAQSWDTPDPRTYVFHLRNGIVFHDGRPLTARDVKWTLDSYKNGTIVSIRAATYRHVIKVDAPDDYTVVVHLDEPDSTLLWNLSDGAFGIVPYGSGKELTVKPIGSGPFRFVSLQQDSNVILERNDHYWATPPSIERIRMNVVPDATTRALELRKGSADLVATNSLGADMVNTLRRDPHIRVQREPGTALVYLAFNLRDPILKDVRVRQALAYAIDRRPILDYLFGGFGRLADSVLPPEHWAYYGNVQHYPYSPEKANELLDEAGFPRGKNGIRFHLTFKTSNTEETSRLLPVALQEQFKKVGIALDIRTFEFAALYSDILKGAFQMYSLRWVGGSNQDPDIFAYAFDSNSFPPKRANRGYYSNPRVDALIAQGRQTVDQAERKRIYAQIQEILAHDLPYIDFWYMDNVLVHTTRIRDLKLSPSGNYDFLTTAEWAK
ncbi:MAG TPA: ABC transporter substrate-binding protein [Candidatus Angelobacter sp.]|nr:ABC transporter substrate-binding protein [Candidatus Angelobacter sp.]